jgi:hypothetical protein
MSLSLPVKSVMMREEMAKRTVSGCRSKTDGVGAANCLAVMPIWQFLITG